MASETTGKGKVFLAITLLAALTASGCNFFGKQTDPVPPPPGQLQDGTSFVGAWSTSYSTPSATNTPTTAMTTTFTLDPSGTARVEARTWESGGATCTGSGQFRLQGLNTVVIYIQGVVPSNCSMPPVIQLANITVHPSGFLSYTDLTTNNVFYLYQDRAQLNAPLGVWKFDGTQGIDYLFLDQHGYFLMQTTAGGQQYLLQGFYTVAQGSLTLNYIQDGDPAQVLGTTVFDSFVTNGSAIELKQTTSQGDLIIDGTLL